MVRRRSTVRFRNGAPQELPARPGQKLTGQLPSYAADGSCCRVGRNLGDRRLCEPCASPSGGLLGQAMASVYSAGQVADALLADAEFRALRLGTWPNTPPARRSGRGHGPDGGAVQTGHRPADRGTATRGAETWPFLIVLARRWHMGRNDEKRFGVALEAHWTAPILCGDGSCCRVGRNLGDRLLCEPCASLSGGLLGQAMASVYSAGQSRTRSLPTPSFEHLGSAPGSTPFRRGRSGHGHGPDGGAVQTGHRPADRGTAIAAQRPGHFSSFWPADGIWAETMRSVLAWRSAAASAAWPVAMTRDVSPTSTVRACRSAGPTSIVKTAAL